MTTLLKYILFFISIFSLYVTHQTIIYMNDIVNFNLAKFGLNPLNEILLQFMSILLVIILILILILLTAIFYLEPSIPLNSSTTLPIINSTG